MKQVKFSNYSDSPAPTPRTGGGENKRKKGKMVAVTSGKGMSGGKGMTYGKSGMSY